MNALNQVLKPLLALRRNTSGVLLAPLIIALLWALIPSYSNAYDLWQEKEITENLLPFINTNKHLWLEIKTNRKVFALHENNIVQPQKGGAILLPNINFHVDWPVLIRPLRKELTMNGWQVLTLQPPTTFDNQDAVYLLNFPAEVANRINAAIDYFRLNNVENIVLIAHGHSANLAAFYLSHNNTQNNYISAFAGISFQHYPLSSSWPANNKSLESIRIPILDIHGRLSNPLIKAATHRRSDSAHFAGSKKKQMTRLTRTQKVSELAFNKTGDLDFRQILLSNSDYNLQDPDSGAAKKIRAWLSNYANK